jgi:hypothetical protein
VEVDFERLKEFSSKLKRAFFVAQKAMDDGILSVY